MLICDAESHHHDKHTTVFPLSPAPALAVHLLEVQHSETGGLGKADIYRVCTVGIATLSKIFASQTTCEEICFGPDLQIAKNKMQKDQITSCNVKRIWGTVVFGPLQGCCDGLVLNDNVSQPRITLGGTLNRGIM